MEGTVMASKEISPQSRSSFDRPWPMWVVVGGSLVMISWALWRWASHPSPADKPDGPAIGLIVDINHADHATLAALPGLGPTTAMHVLESRQNIGRFESVEDLTRVHGIGQGKLRLLKPHITCGDGVTIIAPDAHLMTGAEKRDRPDVDLSLDDSVDAPYEGLSPEPQPSQE